LESECRLIRSGGYFSGKQPKEKNLLLLAKATGLELHASHKSEKQKRPSLKKANPEKPNLKKQIYASRVLDDLQDDLARCIAAIPAVQATLTEDVPKAKLSAPARSGRRIQSLMDALERSLAQVLNDPKALDMVRKTISGSDAGYLSGLLAALFDDRRLQTWQQMTTYKYGSK
jgi:molecular chaperone GrpE (heat shock protein)